MTPLASPPTGRLHDLIPAAPDWAHGHDSTSFISTHRPPARLPSSLPLNVLRHINTDADQARQISACAMSFPITFTRQRRDIKCSLNSSHHNIGAWARDHLRSNTIPSCSLVLASACPPATICVTQGYQRINHHPRPLNPLPDVCRVRPSCVATRLGRTPPVRKSSPGTFVAQLCIKKSSHQGRSEGPFARRNERVACSGSTGKDPEIRADLEAHVDPVRATLGTTCRAYCARSRSC